MTARLIVSLVVGVGTLVSVSAAEGQTTGRPYRGLFGGGVGDATQVLTLNVSFGGGYTTQALLGSTFDTQSTPPAPATGSGQAPLQTTSSTFEQASVALAYSYNRPHAAFSATLSSSAIYFPNLHQPVFTSESGSFGGTFTPAAHTTITASEIIGYQPFYSVAPISQLVNPGGGAVPISIADLNSNIALGPSFYTTTGVGLTQGLTKRLSVSFGATHLTSDSPSTPSLDLLADTQYANLNVQILRGLVAYGGYVHESSAIGAPGDRLRSETQGAQGGLTFTRAYDISLTRRLKLAFGFGATSVSDGHHVAEGLVGNADLTREIGRSWAASLDFNRSIGFSAVFQHPVFADTFSGSIGGLVARRIQFSAQAGYTGGAIGIAQANNAFRTYFATTGVTFGLTRNIGLGTSYSYYRYSLGAGVVVPEGLAQRGDSQTVRAFLTLWEPLFERRGRPNAAR